MDDWSEAHHRKHRQKDSQWPGMEHDLKLDWNLTRNATARMIGSMVDCQLSLYSGLGLVGQEDVGDDEGWEGRDGDETLT